MQLLASAQTSAEVPINENFDTLAHAEVYGRRHPVTTGLTWGFYGGRWGGVSVADGTVALTNATVNYLVVARATGVLTTSTALTSWNNLGEFARVYQLTTAGSVVTAVQDHRGGFGGVHGQMPHPAAVTVASIAALVIALGQRVVTISGTTTITSLTATGHNGAVVTLIFAGVLTFTDGGNLRLAGNFVTTADDTITLACDGVNWFEVSRSVN